MKIPELTVAKSEMQNNYSGSINIIQDEQSNWPELTPIFADTANLQMRPGELRLTIPNMISFRVTNGDRISWCRLSSNVTNQTIRTYMLGSALGAALIQRGILVLHGNALEKHNRAIVCMGYSGAGKSTLAYALMQQGWNLLADDLVAVTPTGLILPGVPRIKLWKDAVCAFNLNPSKLKTVVTGADKFLVQKKFLQYTSNTVPLEAMYLIERRSQNDQGVISQISSEKIMAIHLHNQSFRPNFVQGLGQEGANFMTSTKILKQSPLSILGVPGDIQTMQKWLKNQNLLA